MTPSLIGRVAAMGNQDTASSFSVPFTAVTHVGNRVIMVVRVSSGAVVASVTDSQAANTWAVDKSSASSGVNVSICSAYINSAHTTSDTLTVTTSTSVSAGISAAAYEYSRLLQPSPVDQTASNFNAASNAGPATAGPTGTTGQASELAICAVATNAAEPTLSISGWTIEDSTQASTVFSCVQMADQIVSSTGTFSASWTFEASAAWAVAIVTYKAATADILDTEIEYHYGGGGSASGLRGGAISSALITSGAANNVWDDITSGERATGETTYACTFIKNATVSGKTWTSPKVWLDGLPSIGSVTLALDPAGKNASATTIVNETTAPAGVTFGSANTPSSKGAGLALPDLAPGEYHAIWWKRVIPAGSTGGADSVSVRHEGDTIVG